MSDTSDAVPSDDKNDDHFFKKIGMALRTGFGLRPRVSVRSDLQEALSEKGGVDLSFSAQERAMISNILKLREQRVEDVMVPRADIIAVEQQSSMSELIELFREAGHSRLPVYHESLDDLVGMVHIRDFLSYLTSTAPASAPEGEARTLGSVDLSVKLVDAPIIRPVLFAPPSMPALDLLVKMQTTRIHMALVIDEYGGTDGLVSIEDIIEEVVGDIEDEHDENEQSIASMDNGTWIANARASLEEVQDVVGTSFDPATFGEELSERAEDIDTLGGLMIALVGRVPARGELIKGPNGFQFEVLDADPRRVKRLRIKQTQAQTRQRTDTRMAEPRPPAAVPPGL